MVIRILDHVAQAATYADGEKIFPLIANPIRQGQDVSLSFEGIDAVPSAFINATIVRLIEVANLDEIKLHLSVVDSTRQINNLIRERIAFLSQAALEKRHFPLP